MIRQNLLCGWVLHPKNKLREKVFRDARVLRLLWLSLCCIYILCLCWKFKKTHEANFLSIVNLLYTQFLWIVTPNLVIKNFVKHYMLSYQPLIFILCMVVNRGWGEKLRKKSIWLSNTLTVIINHHSIVIIVFGNWN